jgi:hypothetical protein
MGWSDYIDQVVNPSSGRPEGGGGLITNIEQLVDSMRRAAERVSGARSHIEHVVVDPGLAASCPDDCARFDFPTRTLSVSRATAERLETFLQRGGGQPAQLDVTQKVWLAGTASEISGVLRQIMHSLGPERPAAMAASWRSRAWAGGHCISEGIAEQAGQWFIDEVMRDAGLLAIDPRLSQVPYDRCQEASVEATRLVLGDLSMLTGRAFDKELCTLLRAGSSPLALATHLRDVMQAQDLMTLRCDAVVLAHRRLYSAVTEPLAHITDVVDSAFSAEPRTVVGPRQGRAACEALRQEVQDLRRHYLGIDDDLGISTAQEVLPAYDPSAWESINATAASATGPALVQAGVTLTGPAASADPFDVFAA